MLKGSIVALITPFNENNEVNYNKINDLIEMHVFAGTNALLILGTTAEAPTLTENEKDSIVSYVINKVNKRLKIVVGVITNNTNEGIILAKKYERMGADFLLISPPYYNKTNSNGLIKHFECSFLFSKNILNINNLFIMLIN